MLRKKTTAKVQTTASQPTTASKQAAGKQATGKQATRTQAIGNQAAGKQTAGKQAASKPLTAGQRAYEAKRAAKAGVSLEKWLATKQREQQAEERAKLKAAEAAKPPKKPGLFARLIERAQRPLGSSRATARTPPR